MDFVGVCPCLDLQIRCLWWLISFRSLLISVSIDLPPVRPNGLTGPCPRALIGGAQPYMVGGTSRRWQRPYFRSGLGFRMSVG